MDRGMISLRLYFGVLLALLAGIQLLQQVVLAPADPFAPGQEHRLRRLDQVLNPHLIGYKLRHVRDSAPFDLMLFGNSSILSLGQEQVGGHGRVFNMAVPGSSLASSVSLAHLLAAEGRLAPQVVMMVENFDVFDQQVPMLPVPERWRDNAAIVGETLLDRSIPLRQRLRLAARLAKEEVVLFTSYLNPNILANHLSVIAADLLPEPPAGPRAGLLWGGFNADGSGGGMTAKAAGRVALAARPDQSAVLPAMLAYDLRRLARLSGTHRVIVYESPLEPANQARNLAEPGPRATELRRVFRDTCAEIGLECHLAPMLGEPGQANLWMDHYHPPASSLAPFVASLLHRPERVAGHAVQ